MSNFIAPPAPVHDGPVAEVHLSTEIHFEDPDIIRLGPTTAHVEADETVPLDVMYQAALTGLTAARSSIYSAAPDIEAEHAAAFKRIEAVIAGLPDEYVVDDVAVADLRILLGGRA